MPATSDQSKSEGAPRKPHLATAAPGTPSGTRRAPQCRSTGRYCGHDPRKLAGLEPPCGVCSAFIGAQREAGGWRRHGDTRFYLSATLTPEERKALLAEFKGAPQ